MTRNNHSRTVSKRIVFKISILLLAFYLIYSMILLQTKLVSQRKVLNEKQKTISSLQISNKELEGLLKNGSQEDLIEKAARDKLGFVFANEEIYQDVKGN